MKKLIAFILAALMLCTLCACAKETGTKVCVSISNGALELACEQIAVTDRDKDGKITVSDALYAAHEAQFEGGAKAGYGVEKSEFGLSMTKLWGVENGGAYGYCVNNAGALSLADEVKEGDHVFAYVYQDTAAFSDTYAYFDTFNAEIAKDEKLSLTLSINTFDENWNPVTLPLANAELTVNGSASGVITDENGRAELSVSEDCIVSAKCEGMTLAGPVCVVKVK